MKFATKILIGVGGLAAVYLIASTADSAPAIPYNDPSKKPSKFEKPWTERLRIMLAKRMTNLSDADIREFADGHAPSASMGVMAYRFGTEAARKNSTAGSRLMAEVIGLLDESKLYMHVPAKYKDPSVGFDDAIKVYITGEQGSAPDSAGDYIILA
jgi:hypothetical protein